MPKVSIIIPVYNCEKYLRKCLESVLNQTFKNFEVICINDGSTDSSLSILENYAKQDSRITVLSQKNAKQGTARNRGFDVAKGEYIVFLDSDDWLDLNYLERMLDETEKTNSDVAVSKSTRDYKYKIKKHLEIKEKEEINDINILLSKINYDLRVTGRMYKKAIIEDIRFIENVLFEDAPYAIRALHRAKKTVLVPDTTYHYFSNPKSTIKIHRNYFLQDKVITALDLINYTEENNIHIKDWEIYRKDYFFWKIKYFKYHTDYYFCGIKIWEKQTEFNSKLNN